MKNNIVELILKTPSSNNNRLIGVEIENIVYTNKGKRLHVNPSADYSASDMLIELNNNKKNNNEDFNYSIEPGGQIEWSSSPYLSLHNIQQEYNRHIDIFRKILIDNNLFTLDYTVDPIYSPSSIELIDNIKYQLMNNLFAKTGRYGKWMMRNTASVQVNIDILTKQDGEQMAFISDCISPFVSLLFSNSPYINSEPVGESNFRHKIWSQTDSNRCGYLYEHGILAADNLIDKFSDIVLNAPAIFSMDNKHSIKEFNGPIKNWLSLLYENNKLDNHILNAAIHQIFTHVRFKEGMLELRCADRPPAGYEFAPVAFWAGILTDNNIRDKLMEIFVSWDDLDRKLVIRNASSLNLENFGPQNKSMLDWINLFAELAIEGLSNRSHNLSINNESDLILPYLEIFWEKGIPGVYRQNEPLNDNKSLEEFLKEHI